MKIIFKCHYRSIVYMLLSLSEYTDTQYMVKYRLLQKMRPFRLLIPKDIIKIYVFKIVHKK